MNANDLFPLTQPLQHCSGQASPTQGEGLSAIMNSRNSMPIREQLMRDHRAALANCSRCPAMIGPVVSGSPVLSSILLIGQAPGDKEGGFGKPFAWPDRQSSIILHTSSVIIHISAFPRLCHGKITFLVHPGTPGNHPNHPPPCPLLNSPSPAVTLLTGATISAG